MSDYIPPHVLIKILLELPVKSLVRFTLVSKTWQAFITSSDFIVTYLSRVQYDPTFKNRSQDALMIRYYSDLDMKEHYELRPDDYSFLHKFSEIKLRVKSREGFNQIVGSCNGVICLCDNLCGYFSTFPIVLWNPSIQKDIVLPLPEIESSTKCFVLGFGYDVERDDYKVVRILYGKGFMRKPVVAEIFSLRNNLWKTAENFSLKGYINDIGQSQVYFNGIIHWMAYQEKGDDGDLQNSILGFDCSDEEFIETVLPDDLADLQLNPNLHITAHKGCLAMISYDSSSCRIWEMKEYGSAESWSQLYFFEWTQLYEVPLCRGMAKIVGFRNTGELLVTLMLEDDKINVSRGRSLRAASGDLISYNPRTREVIKLPQNRGWIDSFHVLEYVETLSLLDYSYIYPKNEANNARLEETDYPIMEELFSQCSLKGESDEHCIFEVEDSKGVHGFGDDQDENDDTESDEYCIFDMDLDSKEALGFGKFKDNKDENDSDDDLYIGEVNHDNQAVDHSIVPMEEFDDSETKDVKNVGNFCVEEEVNADDEDDIVPMEELDDSWILVHDD